MILRYDGLDAWESVDWELLHPQESNDDNEYDVDESLVSEDKAIMASESVWLPSTVLNDVQIDVDDGFISKRRQLIQHFYHCYRTNKLRWPKRFSALQKENYVLASELGAND